MADAIQIAVPGGGVPPMPGQSAAPAPAGVPPLPPAAQQVPGYVNPAQPAGQFSQADMDRAVAAALAASKVAAPAAAPAAAPTTPAAPITSEADDAVLSAYSESFQAIGQGIDLERAIGKALQFGKPELIDSAYIAEKGGAHAKQLEVIAKAIVERVQSQAQAGATAAHDIAGGPDNWNAASAAFNSAAPEHLKQVVIEMINSGKPERIKAGAKLVVEYAQSGGLVAKAPGMVQAGVAGGMPVQALSKAEYQAARLKLDKQDRNYATQAAALFTQRQAGVARGL